MLTSIDNSWHESLTRALGALSPEYRDFLESSTDFIPSRDRFLSAFSTLPKDRVKYNILPEAYKLTMPVLLIV